MKKMVISLLVVFGLLSVGCDSLESAFGCSKKSSVLPIDLQLGKPGETIHNNTIPKNDDVEVLTESETIEFIKDDGLAWVHHNEDRILDEDDVIVANEQQKYLVKVKEIKERHDKKTKVILRQSRISDIVGERSGAIEMTSTPVYSLKDMDDLNRKAKQASGKDSPIYHVDKNGKITIRNLELFSVNINNDGRISKGVNKILGIPVKDPYERFEVSGAAGGMYRAVVNSAEIEVIPTIRNKAEWDWGRISKMNARLDTKVRYRMDISYQAAGHIKLEVLMKKFMPKKIIPVRIPGTPPVYLDVELAIPAGASIKAEAKGESRVVFESEYLFYSYINYDKETGLVSDKDYRTVIKEKAMSSKQKSMKLEAEVFLKPMVTARFYRVVGASGYVRPFLRGEFEFPSVRKKDDLFIGANGAVGLELSEPIFLSNIVSYNSDEYKIFESSFDLDGAGQPGVSPFKVDSQVDRAVTVDRIGPEGFVTFKLKEDQEQFLRYELLAPPKTGLMIPSETFFMDGELYYYPLADSTEESFKVRITGQDGSSEEIEIAIKPTAKVIKEVAKDRFGTTTNSYQVSSGTTSDFSNQVPQYNLGGGRRVGITEFESEFDPHLSLAIRQVPLNPRDAELALQVATRAELTGRELLKLVDRFMGQQRGAPESGLESKDSSESFRNNRFGAMEFYGEDFYELKLVNPYHFVGYLIMNNLKRLECLPGLRVEVTKGFSLDVTYQNCGLENYFQSQFTVEHSWKPSGRAPKLDIKGAAPKSYSLSLEDREVEFSGPLGDLHLIIRAVSPNDQKSVTLYESLISDVITVSVPLSMKYRNGFYGLTKIRSQAFEDKKESSYILDPWYQ